MCQLKVPSALPNALIQHTVLLLQFKVKKPGFQEVIDSKYRFIQSKWFGEKVLSPQGECCLLALLRQVPRDDQERKIHAFRNAAPQLLKQRQPVHMRHTEVQQDEIGLEFQE